MRVRIGIGTIGEDSEEFLPSSKVALGDDIERPLTNRKGGVDDVNGSSDGLGGSDIASTGWVWLRVGATRVLCPGLSPFSVGGGALLARRARRSFRLGFEAWPGDGIITLGDGAIGDGSGEESFAGTGGRSISAKTGGNVGGAIPAMSMRGLGGRRERDTEDGADEAALPGRFGPTSCAKGASSESESSDELDEDEEDEAAGRVVFDAGFAGAAAVNELRCEVVHAAE